MDLGWWKNPRHVFPILMAASLVTAVSLWGYQATYPGRDLSLPYNLSLGSFTAFLGATIALWVYSYLSLESQRREWRHDLEVRHFEQIYGPLYEDTMKVVDELTEYERVRLYKWRGIRESSIGPFVEEEIAKGMSDLEAKLDEYHNVAYRAEIAAELRFDEFMSRHGRTAALNKNDRASIWANLRDDHRFLYDPKTALPLPARVELIPKLLPRTEGTDVSVEEAKAFLREAKAYLLEDEAIKKRIAECERLLPDAERVHELISRRMRDPFR